jgi:hypothetical protein
MYKDCGKSLNVTKFFDSDRCRPVALVYYGVWKSCPLLSAQSDGAG